MKRALLVTLVLASAACGEEFDPFNRLTKLRVLAVKSDPVAPAPGETTTLSALLYTPEGEAVTGYAWSWCPFPGSTADGSPCLVTEDELAMLGGGAAGDIPAFDLGDGETATLEHTVNPAILETLCTGTPDAPALVSCEGGFPVQIKLTVRTATSEVVAIRELRLRFDTDEPGNVNPTIDGLVALVDGDELPIDGATLPRERSTVIRALVPMEASESFMSVDEDGDPIEERERLTLTWFIESGDTDSERTGFVEEVTTFDDAMENEWEPADVDDYPAERARIVVVIRDERNGVAWTEGSVTLEDAP